jgi:hypothetical protein
VNPQEAQRAIRNLYNVDVNLGKGAQIKDGVAVQGMMLLVALAIVICAGLLVPEIIIEPVLDPVRPGQKNLCLPNVVKLKRDPCRVHQAKIIKRIGIGHLAGADNSAYVIYTSGSTGDPKGVMLTHLNMVSAATSITTYLENREDDIIIDVLPLSFDYGLYQVLMAFKFGGTVVLEKSFTYPYQVIQKMIQEKVTGFLRRCHRHNSGGGWHAGWSRAGWKVDCLPYYRHPCYPHVCLSLRHAERGEEIEVTSLLNRWQ